MTDSEWDRWTDFYSACFALSSESDAAMFLAWQEVFATAQYTSDELNRAGKEIALSPPKFKTEHLPRIHAVIRDFRRQATLEREAKERMEAERNPAKQAELDALLKRLVKGIGRKP